MVGSAGTGTPAAVVIGLDSVTGLQTARLLAGRGVPVIGVARNARHPSCRTNTCDRIVVADTGSEQLVDTLDTLRGTLPEPPVLFPCTDLSVLITSRHREALAGYCSVLPAPGVLERLLDKACFSAYAVEVALPVARTSVLRSRADAAAAADLLRFPCVLKPAVKTALWQSRTSAKVFRVATAVELLRVYDHCRAWTDRLIAQEWVDGPDSCHFTCNAYFDAASNAHVTFVSQKLRQWPLEGGVGCLSRECRNDTVRSETIRLFHGVGHRGLAYLEMKLDPRDGRYVIIEPNVGRPTGRSAAADASGVDLLYTQYCDALGWPLPPAREQSYGTTAWIYLRQDLQSAVQHMRRGTLTPAAWMRSLRGCRRDAMFSWKDPRPFLADVWAAARKALVTPAGRDSEGTRGAQRETADFDIHGVVGIRLIDASMADVAAVAKQIGAARTSLNREPDVIVRFVDELEMRGLRWVEFGRTGFTEDGFYLLQSDKRPARAKIPLDRVGGTCEIVCQRGLGAVPLLVAIVNLTALGRGYVPVHASAFVHRGTGVLVTGWAKGGKTGSLLAFGADGADYVGDDWILLTPDGQMLGVAQPMRVQGWHLRQLPHLCRTVRGRRRLLFESIRALDSLFRNLPAVSIGRPLEDMRVSKAMEALRRRLSVRLDPLAIFGPQRRLSRASLDTVFFMVSHDTATMRVDRADPSEIAGRMAASGSYELLPLMSAYFAYRSAFPGRRNELLEHAGIIQSETLEHIIGRKAAYVVRHAYPCDLQGLRQVMAPMCSSDPALLSHESSGQRFAAATVMARTSHG